MAPGLVSGKVQFSSSNGHDSSKYESSALKSTDFNAINSRYEEHSYNILANNSNVTNGC